MGLGARHTEGQESRVRDGEGKAALLDSGQEGLPEGAVPGFPEPASVQVRELWHTIDAHGSCTLQCIFLIWGQSTRLQEIPLEKRTSLQGIRTRRVQNRFRTMWKKPMKGHPSEAVVLVAAP